MASIRHLIQEVRRAAILCATIATVLPLGCGNYPTPLRTGGDIARASTETEMITIADLPVEEFAALSKFKDVTGIRFHDREGTGTTDAKLKALATLNLSRLRQVNLQNSSGVTDEGVQALSTFKSIEFLNLEGTSITDASLRTLAEKLRLRGVNVINCHSITAEGLIVLAALPTMEELAFSTGKLQTNDAVQLIRTGKSLKYVIVMDPQMKLSTNAVAQAKEGRDVRITVRR